MRGKLIGILVEDFRLYHEIVNHLKSKGVRFVSLSSGETPPPNVGAMIVSKEISNDIDFEKKVVCESRDDVEFSVNKSLQLLRGKTDFGEIVIGIDPGAKPGIAVLADGDVLNTLIAKSPEDVLSIVNKTKDTYPSNELKIRIGHGDKINRNRIINSLIAEDLSVEVVDEDRTTRDARQSGLPKSRDKRVDALAALQIAKGRGRIVKEVTHVPTKGEIKTIQTRSRQMSDGRITISKELAELVVKGKLSIEEAIALQTEGKKNNANDKVASEPKTNDKRSSK
jgi:hypothetical protein